MIDTLKSYSVPVQSHELLVEGIIKNSLHKDLPQECEQYTKYVKYTGSALPSIPINWRFAESVAALKGLEAILILALLKRKYNEQPQEVIINTDHAQTFFMSSLVLQINPDFSAPIEPTPIRELNEKYANYFPNRDIHKTGSSLYRKATYNIYKTKDNRFFHIHGSLNPNLSLSAADLPLDIPEIKSIEESWPPFEKRLAQKTAAEWDQILGEDAKQAGTICLSVEEYQKSPQGQANSKVGLYNVVRQDGSDQPASWWPSTDITSVKRPLAGLKIVDLTRVIAGPAIGRGLAELGASVMRVTASHLPDFSGLQADLNWGKWNCNLDLRKNEDKEKLKELILDADVVINGYRPGVFEKYGFGYKQVFELVKKRDRGIIYVRENCFGWDGPLSHRSGWQGISDAHSGIAMGFGRAMGNDEPVIPVFPNSDYCTGIAGTCAVLQALMEKDKHGGSYLIDTALNYYNHWLGATVGEYPPDVWEHVWKQHGGEVFRHYHSMNFTIPRVFDMMKRDETVLNQEFFQKRTSKALNGLEFRMPKPVIQFSPNTVSLQYNVGTRGNGIDAAHWPKDLTMEVVR